MPLALQNETAKLTFIGAGNMASCIIGGLISNGFPTNLICASDPNESALKKLSDQHGIHISRNNATAIAEADAIILAVKPQIMQPVLTNIATDIQGKQPLIISIAAGITINNIQRWLASNLPIVRTMPNTPALVQTGATGLYANAKVNSIQKALAVMIFESIGIAVWFDNETDMDRVVALSGSGPAYFFLVMEAIEKAGIELGLTPEVARKLTLQTALGSAKLALTENLDPAELRRRVTSPGGTTEAAIHELQEGGMVQLFAKAIQAAATRSKELAG